MTCSSSRAWVPIDDAGLAAGDPRAAASARWALVIEPVSSATVVRLGGAAEHAAGGEVAEHRGDRAVVLLGEHLGRARAARPGRRSRRPAASRAARPAVLPEPTSPWSSRFIGCGWARSASISAPTSRWPGGQRRTAAARRTPPAARLAAGARLGAERAQDRAAPGQHQLGDQRLLEPEPALGAGRPAPRSSGAWIQSSAVAGVEQVVRRRGPPSGSRSGTSSTTVQAKLTARWRSHDSTPLVSG